MLNFYVEFFGDRFSAAFAVLTAEKYAQKIRGKIRRKNSAEKLRVSLRFSLCFSLFSGHPELRAIVSLQIEKIRAESVLQEISFKSIPWKFSLSYILKTCNYLK